MTPYCKGNDDSNVRVVGDEEGKGSKAMAMALVTRMAGKCNGNKEVNGNSNKGGGQAMVAVAKRAMVTATRVAGDKKAMVTAADGDKGGG